MLSVHDGGDSLAFYFISRARLAAQEPIAKVDANRDTKANRGEIVKIDIEKETEHLQVLVEEFAAKGHLTYPETYDQEQWQELTFAALVHLQTVSLKNLVIVQTLELREYLKFYFKHKQ